MGERKLFILSCVLVKQGSGETELKNALAYRVSDEGEDATVGRFTQQMLETNPGFSMSGKVAVMEVPREHLAHLEATP